ncbi:hypothetical protein BDZ97DRAFT_1904098 [Flammula alnicola]|nr:hypothetical protein BDZ97DRAFT_1904098 [Flammula alnicola]
MTTPSRSSYLRNASSTSYSPTVTGNNQQKLNVVTRVAIEGKAKKGQDGASIRMFLKICLPLDSVTPGSTVPLFPEENVKIHSSQVHPLDHNSVPYNFSSTVSPLLHNAARALNLPGRSHENFASVFNLAQSNGNAASSRSLKSESGENIPPIDVQYTGHIIVSGYSISFVLPKVFLSRRRNGGALSDNEEDGISRTPASRRRASVGERNQAQFMAAIDMWVPFISKPPRSPYLLSIPTPRCLHNHVKLRIFPPANTAMSFASLSSIEEDSAAWDLTSDPHVTRSPSTRPSRAHSYTHFADDESSDSSITGMSEDAAERIRVRWAKPMKNFNIPGEENGRRRVGVEEVKGEMTCIVRGKGSSATNPEIEGVLMHVEYKGQCKGVWFPGVATLLGLDVGLEAKGSDICWPKGYPTQWEVSGGAGYTGFDNGPSTGTNGSNSRTSSMDSNGQTQILRSNVTLPSSSGTLSSISSLPTSSAPNLPSVPQIRPPGSPVTLHLNMNELQPPIKNAFTFSIAGTVLVTARATLARINGLNASNSSSSDKPSDPEPIVLPRFTSASVEVFHPTGDIYTDPQTRKTVLQKSGFTRCGEDGGRIALKFLDAFNMTTNGYARPVNRPRTPSNSTSNRVSSNSPLPRAPFPSRSKREGPTVIPWVKATVTALAPDADMFPTGYAVRVSLQAPPLVDSEWLEFGIASGLNSSQPSNSGAKANRKIHIICATLDGVPVRAETTKASKTESAVTAGGVPFEELSGKEWICWGKVYAGTSAGSSMVIDYIVKEEAPKSTKGKHKLAESMEMNILLPTFFVSLARLEVKIDVMPGLEISSMRSNFDYHHALPKGNRLLRYSLEEFSQPQLSLTIRKIVTKPDTPLAGLKRYFILTWVASFITFCSLYRVLHDVQQLRRVADGEGFSTLIDSWAEVPTVTVTTTVHGSGGTRRWFGEPSTETSSTSTSSYVHPVAPTATTAFPLTLTSQSTPIGITTPSATPQDPLIKDSSLTNITPSILESYGLVPVENLFTFTWSDHHAKTLKRTLETIIGTMEVVWTSLEKYIIIHWILHN